MSVLLDLINLQHYKGEEMKVYFENGLTVIDTGDPAGGHKNKYGCTGVYYHSERNAFDAEIKYNKKRYKLGYYTNLEDAIAIRKEAEKHRDNATLDEWFQTLYGTIKRKQPTKGKKVK